MSMTMSESILRRARLSGKCPPSLVLNEPEKDNSFEEAVVKVIDKNGKGVRFRFLVFLISHVSLSFRAQNFAFGQIPM